MKYYFLHCEPIKVSWLAWCKLHWQGFLLAGFLFSLQVSVYAVSSFFCCHRFGFTSLQRLGLLLWPRTRPFASPAGHRVHSILKEDRKSSKVLTARVKLDTFNICRALRIVQSFDNRGKNADLISLRLRGLCKGSQFDRWGQTRTNTILKRHVLGQRKVLNNVQHLFV